MSILNDIVSNRVNDIIKIQQQPNFPLKYDKVYGPYKPITSPIESIKKDFINLLLTSPGEWPMSPRIGVGLRRYLFELPNSEILQQLAPNIKQQLKEYLPVVTLEGLKFDYLDEELDQNKLRIILAYSISGVEEYMTTFSFSPSSNEVEVTDIQSSSLQGADLLNRHTSLVSDIITL